MTSATKGSVDELATLRQRLQRREDRAQVRADARARKVARKSRQRIAELRQRAALAGERARVRHEVAQSGEARAMRVERTRAVALAVLLPVLAAFGGWSAAGVRLGMIELLDLHDPGEGAARAAAWLIEPALIGVVAGIILIRARLRSAGGDLDDRATKIEVGALAVSILLNIAGHWPDSVSVGTLAALLGHSLGPVGAAATAYLISVVQDGVAAADPWMLPDGRPAPTLTASDSAASSAQDTPAPRPATVWPVPVGQRRLLPIVARPTAAPDASEVAGTSTGDQAEQPVSEAPAVPAPQAPPVSLRKRPARRADKGVPVPPSARKRAAESVSVRALSDGELAARLAARIDAGDIAPDASVRAVQSALGIGFARAKRVMAMVAEHRRAAGQVAA